MVQAYRVFLAAIVGIALPLQNSFSAELVTIDIPCLNNDGSIRNAKPGQTYCKSQFKACGTQNNEIKENIRKNLAAVIAGRYIGLQIDTQASTEEQPVGKPWNNTICSVVGDNLKQYINGNSSTVEIKDQKIYRKSSCGTVPRLTLTKDYMTTTGTFEIGVKNGHGKSWVGYMHGANTWTIKRIAYEYLQKLGNGPMKISAECAYDGSNLQGVGSTTNRLEQSLSSLVQALNQNSPDACNTSSGNNAIDCSAPSTNPAAPAYCNMKMISQLLFNSKFEQQLTCQILKDAVVLSDLTVGYVFAKDKGDVPTVDPNAYDSDVLKTVLRPSISLEAQSYFVQSGGAGSGSIFDQLNKKIKDHIRDDAAEDLGVTYEDQIEDLAEEAAGKAAASVLGEDLKQVGTLGDQIKSTSASGNPDCILYTPTPSATYANRAVAHQKWDVKIDGSRATGFVSVIENVIKNQICAASANGDNKCDPAGIDVKRFEGKGAWR